MFTTDQISIIIVVVSNIVLWTIMIRLNKWSKTIELTSLYMTRYNDIMKEQNQVEKKKMLPEVWWKLFWNLQQEQYLLWKKGCIDKNFYNIWIEYRRREWEGDWKVGRISIKQSFENLNLFLIPEFKDFIKEKLMDTNN